MEGPRRCSRSWHGSRYAAASELPPDLEGGIVFVSDRDGTPALYWRRLPRDRERRLTFGSEPVSEPAVSPDGTRVAFSMNGRIGVVAVASGEVSVLTLGVDWKDAQPAWLADGRRLVVAARRRAGEPASLYLLEPGADGSVARHPLTQARAGDDHSPAPSPDGGGVVFVREDRLMRVELADGRVARLSGSFKRDRSPRFLGDGRLVCAWSEGKKHGIDAIELATKTRDDAHAGRGVLPHARALARRALPRRDPQLGLGGRPARRSCSAASARRFACSTSRAASGDGSRSRAATPTTPPTGGGDRPRGL